MFSKWEKDPSVVKFTIHTIDIKKNIEDQFKLSWKRGKYKGATSRVIAMNQTLTFNEPFSCKCTMYISKHNQSVRQKDITFTLTRIDPQNDELKVFGKVKINLSQFFGKVHATTCTVDMESKHARRPTMTAAFVFKKTGQSSEINIDESSKKDSEASLESSLASEKWDTTESTLQTGSTNSSDTTSQQSSLSKPSSINNNSNGNGNNASDDKNVNSSQLTKFQRRNGSRTRNQAPVSPLMPSQNLIDFMGLKNKEHIQLFESVLKVAWPAPLSPSFISMPYQYPPAVFPLLATLLKSRIFESEEPLEENLYDQILDLMQKAPLSISCSNEKRFVTFLVIYILLNKEADTYHLDRGRVNDFSSKFKLVVDKALIAFGKPLLGRSEQFCSHFLSASFDVNELLTEFSTNMKDVQNLLMLPSTIKNAVLSSFTSMVDARLLTKMISNPSLLTFKNAMMWSSFMTALDGTLKSNNNDNAQQNQNQQSPLILSNEASKMLMMATTLGNKPELTKEVCPHLPPHIVLFLLVHVRPDEIMAQPIDASKFVEHFGMQIDVDDDNGNGSGIGSSGGIVDVAPLLNEDYLAVADSIRLQDWCRCELQAEVVAKFPFFREYLKVEPKAM